MNPLTVPGSIRSNLEELATVVFPVDSRMDF